MVDPWLSDHATGDAMGRFPRLRFNVSDLGPIHAVFLSHAHCDHLVPYSLSRLWQELESPPVLLLPVSLSFLIPVLEEYLKRPTILVLEGHQAIDFRGLELLGFFDVGYEVTNEEDVMVLVVTNGAERVLVEADARLALELPNFRQYISMLMRAPNIESAVYLTTENELTGTLESRNCRTIEQREAVRQSALSEMWESVNHLYAPVDDPMDLWQSDQLLRLVHGQGLTAPHELDARWQKVLFPVRIEDRIKPSAWSPNKRLPASHRRSDLDIAMIKGRIEQQEALPGLVLLDHEEQRTFDGQLSFFPPLPCAPLHQNPRDIDAQRVRILTLLNERFLPYLHGLRQPPVLHLLATHGGSYRIRVHYGHTVGACVWDYVLRYEAPTFSESPVSESSEQEAYWANDLVDFLDGRCDEFSPFCRDQFPVDAMRLWSCLATPLMHSDLVTKKVRLHFERASQGLCPESWVMAMYAASPESSSD